MNLIMAVDQFLSTVLGGHPDDTLSQRLGRAHLAGTKWTEPLRIFVDTLAHPFDKNHCLNSLKGKTNAREVWNWGASRTDIRVEE